MTKHFYWIDLRSCPRILSFPFPVDTIGSVLMEKDGYHGTHKGGMEFCVRMRSWGETAAVDRIDGREYVTPYPHFFIQREGPRHDYDYLKPRESFFVIYNPRLEPLFEASGIGPQDVVWPLEITPEFAQTVRALRDLFPVHAQRGVADQIDALSWTLVTQAVVMRPEDPAERDPWRDRIHAVATDLQTHYRESHDMDRIAAKHGLSRRSFYRHWSRHHTQSPIQYLNNIRLTHAAGLLTRSSLTVAEISYSVGFADVSYFIGAFRRLYGATPLAFRTDRQLAPAVGAVPEARRRPRA